MNNEALRKEIYEELHSQYESKLKDAKKQKSLLEEELESASEKWRAERRRLNSEIDRLETALADNRDTRRKSGDAKSSRAESQDLAKAQAAADEKLKKATHEWEAERKKLQGEISRLQGGVAELLERANNPMRAGQVAREQMETKLDEALKSRKQAEDALLQATAQWEKEKLKLAGEMIRLRRSIGSKSAEPVEDRSREKELEKQLADAVGKLKELEAEIEKARAEVSHAREAQSPEIHRLTTQINSIRTAAAKEYADLTDRERRENEATREATEKELQKARGRIKELEMNLDRSRIEILSAREAQSAEVLRLTAHLESVRTAATREQAEQVERERQDNATKREALERDLQKAQKDLDLLKGAQAADIERQTAQLEESQKAHARIKELEQRLAGARDSAEKEQLGHIEQERRENAIAREALERDLQKAQKEIELLRGTQSADMERQSEQLQESQKAHAKIKDLERRLAETKESAGKERAGKTEPERPENAIAREALERDLQKARKEIELLRGAQSADMERQAEQLQESQKAHAKIKDLERRLAETKESAGKETASSMEKQVAESASTRQTLERDLQKAQKEIELLRGTQSADMERQAEQLQESQKAHAKIKDLERRLAETKESAGKETASRMEKQVAESASSRQTLERELQKAQKEAAQLQEKQSEELQMVMARLEEAQAEIHQLERQLEETRDAVSAEVVAQLRIQYDERVQEMIRQKTELSEQLNSASELLEAERTRFAAAAAQSKTESAKATASGPTIAPEVLNAEFARVEGKIAEIARLIDDPSSELSLVIRKNVERAELDAYLKGILFSLGRNKGL